MEPENQSLEKEIPIGNHHLQVNDVELYKHCKFYNCLVAVEETCACLLYI